MNPISISDTIVQEITIKGSADRIFEALTNPGQRVKWWGAKGRFQTTHMESDLRLGGKWLMRGIGPGGKALPRGRRISPNRATPITRVYVASRLAGGCDRNDC